MRIEVIRGFSTDSPPARFPAGWIGEHPDGASFVAKGLAVPAQDQPQTQEAAPADTSDDGADLPWPELRARAIELSGQNVRSRKEAEAILAGA